MCIIRIHRVDNQQKTCKQKAGTWMPAFFDIERINMAYSINLNKKLYLRECAIKGARNFNHYLIGKKFMIICADGTVETVRFLKRDYIHLTGIISNLSDNAFFSHCVKDRLSTNNIYDRQKYNWGTLKGKAKRVQHIHKIVYANVKDSLFMLNMHTGTDDYPVAIRNKTTDTCIGFKNSIRKARTLRKFSNSANADREKKIAAIFAKKMKKIIIVN